jgi:hypothetical protein
VERFSAVFGIACHPELELCHFFFLECGDLSPLSFWGASFFDVAQVLRSQKVAPHM